MASTTIGPATHGVQSTSTFTSMALDIHIIVLQYLDPLDIISLRKTCKTLEDATHQRIVWMNALTKMCLKNTVYLRSYPVADMSIPQLEYAASNPERWSRYIRKHAGEEDFTPPSLTRSLRFGRHFWHERDLPNTSDDMKHLYLVPGGRFLITLMQCHMIHVWDLGIVGIAEPKAAPIAEISSKGIWFSTHPTPDGEGLRIITSDQYYGIDTHFFEVFEIYPWKPDAELKRIASVKVEIQYGLDFTSVVGNLLILVCGSVVEIWNFVTRDWATLNPGRPSRQILATDKCIILVESYDLSVWDIPSLSSNITSDHSNLEHDIIVTQPRTRIAYPVGFESLDRAECAGLCEWYSGSSQPLWFDFIEGGRFVFHRFKINIDDLDLPTIPLSSEYSFRIRQHSSMSVNPYRVCGDDVSILTFGVDGIAIHAGSSSPDDSHDVFFLSRRPTRCKHRQISFCPISGRLCCIGRRKIKITDYSPSPF